MTWHTLAARTTQPISSSLGTVDGNYLCRTAVRLDSSLIGSQIVRDHVPAGRAFSSIEELDSAFRQAGVTVSGAVPA
ncbi:hypothetical protein ACFWUW_24380 [Streptomyces sp. NPDC058655]|uniref:hypothetical protein n=1 Tax=unclassified Streptomyces TaxID=2593676 RepID=UPI003653301C